MHRCLRLFAKCLLAQVSLLACTLAQASADSQASACAPGDPDRAAAERELDAIDAAIAALDIAADPATLTARIVALSKTPCLRLMDDLDLSPTSGLSLKTYWSEGGSDHLRGYLELRKSTDPTLWLAPTTRRALTLETNSMSPIRELLCPFADAACGVEARGWAVRAQHEFNILAVHSDQTAHDGSSVATEPAECATVAARAEPVERFGKLRQCVAELQGEHAALPIGRTRALDHGWLIMEGRRGHYSFCDETRAYDLATGSAYRVASCSALALQPGGRVSFRATDDQRHAEVEMGHLPVQALREAAWMLLMLDEIDRNVVDAVGVNVPSGIPLIGEEGAYLRGFGLSSHWTSGDTELTWRVDADARTMKAGTLTWSPEPLDDAPAEHTATLLRIAEASLVLDCADVAPPATLLHSEPALSASALDADRKGLRAAAHTAADDWHKIAMRQRECSQAARATRLRLASPRVP